ncbi:MAG: isocitrate lyase/phosphoenolpyruvate mutase family protein [Pseudomonadota bacterium]|nr:isocitrate lyase/phosphoenolpyruvate mutase family protein [Pseudomonadota bacterium]
MIQQDKAELFNALHLAGKPLILFNVWDAGSAKVVAQAGARAIATGSWSVAAAHGYQDGEKLPLDLALANLARIVAAVDLPVSVDLERGYGDDAAAVGRTVAQAIAAGAIGCNLEDSKDEHRFYDTREQSERLRAARGAAEAAGLRFFINARVDIFLRSPASAHGRDLLEQALERAAAYAEAGASGIFVPGLADSALIAAFCEACPKPVNIMAAPGVPPTDQLSALGVARISHAGGPYRRTMKFLEDAAREIYSGR